MDVAVSSSSPSHHVLYGLFLLVMLPLSVTPLSFDIKNFVGSELLFENGAGASFDGCLQLVTRANWGPAVSKAGRVWHPSPLLLWNSSGLAGFTTDFNFNSGSGPVGGSSLYCGIDFFLKAPDASLDIGPTGSFLAVKFDCGGGGPGSDQVKISISSTEAVAHRTLPQSFTGYPAAARVVYDARSRALSVYMSHPLYPYRLAGPPVLSYDVDLSKSLPGEVSVGLSGAGDPSRLQTVCSWSFTSEFIVTLPAAASLPTTTQSPDSAPTGTPPSPTAVKSDSDEREATGPSRKRIGIIVGPTVAAAVLAILGAGAWRIYINVNHQTNINGKCDGPPIASH